MRPAERLPLIVAVITEDVAAVLAESDPPFLERLLSNPDTIDKMVERKKPPPKAIRSAIHASNGKARGRDGEGGHPWEGPRISFTLFLGESAIWSGPDSLEEIQEDGLTRVCRFCAAPNPLPTCAYCLGCQRSGQDDRIGRPSEFDLKRRPPERRSYQRNKLKGGTGD